MRRIFVCKVPSLNPRKNMSSSIRTNRTRRLRTASLPKKCPAGKWLLRSWQFWICPLLGPRDCPETSARNCHSTERKIPKDRKFYTHRGGSLKRTKLTVVQLVKISPTCYAAQKFMTLLTTAHHWSKTRPTSHPPRPLGSLYYYYYYMIWMSLVTGLFCLVDSSWNVMAHGDAREGKWRGNWWMEWVASTLHTTSEHGVSSITTADAHTSVASSRLNWRPRWFKWTRPFRRKTKSDFCACAITFHLASTTCGAQLCMDTSESTSEIL